MPARFLSAFTIASLALAVSGCGPSSRVAITQSRPLTEAERSPVLQAGSQDRFKFALPAMTTSNPMAPASASAAPDSAPLQWDTPPGWTVQEHPMRDISFSFGDSGECYVMRAGGSLADNVNRWRQQMGLPPITAEEAAKLPTRALFGKPAFAPTLDGAYQGMGAQEAAPEYRMVGLILPEVDSGQSLFVKMVGPRALVEANEPAFHAFCDSLRVVQP